MATRAIHCINNYEKLTEFVTNFKNIVNATRHNKNYIRRVYLLNKYTINIRATKDNIDDKLDLLIDTFNELELYEKNNIFKSFNKLQYSSKLSHAKTNTLKRINNNHTKSVDINYDDINSISILLKNHTSPYMFSFTKNHVGVALYNLYQDRHVLMYQNQLHITLFTPYAIYVRNVNNDFEIPESLIRYCLINDKNFWNRFKYRLQVSAIREI